MGKILKVFGLELAIDTEEDIQSAAETLEAKHTEFNIADKFIKALRQEFGDDMSLDNLKDIKANVEDAKKYRAFLVNEIIKYGTLLGLIEKSAVEGEREFYQGLEIERLEKERTKLMKKYDEIHPNTGVLPDNQDDKDRGDKVEVKGSRSAYQAPVS